MDKLKRNIIIAFITLSLLFWFVLWLYGKYYVSTDDAYVNANVVEMTPRVTGQVDAIYVSNNQYVKQGDRLFQIDRAPFVTAQEQAQATFEKSEAELTHARMTADRTLALVKKHFLSQQEGDNVTANLKDAEANHALSKATLEQANLNLEWTTVTAPANGYITNFSLRQGDVVPANQPLFALISDQEYWVDANFKETELQHIKPHQVVSVHVDMYPHHTFKGTVESLSNGTGAAFSLLPPQNATGNWVKVAQRIPVRVRITDPTQQFPLRIGTSASVTVHL